MIQSIHKGRGFRGLLEYVLDPSKNPELVAGNMYGTEPRSLAKEFGDHRALRPGLGKAVFHSSLSLPHGELGREALDSHAWRDVAERYLEHLGFDRSPFVVVRHRDTGHDHVHIVAARIDADGRTVSDSHDYRRGEEVLRRLERDFGLTPVRSSHEVERSAMKAAEVAQLERTGEASVRLRLQNLLDRAVADRPTMGELVRRLEAAGVEVTPRIAHTGHVSGMSFRLDGVAFRGSALGRAYSFRGLQERLGVAYEPARDLPILHAAAERALGLGLDRGSTWSPAALEALAKQLGGLRPGGDLRAELARTLLAGRRASAPVQAGRLLFALRSRQSALRHLARRAPGLGGVALALDAAVALRSPLGIALFGARLAGSAGRALLAGGRDRASSSPIVRRVVAAYVRAAALDRPAGSVFFARLREAGVEPVVLRDGRGRPRALAYRLDGELVAGQEVGRPFTLEGVQRLGGDHDPTRDLPRGGPDREPGGPRLDREPSRAGRAPERDRTPGAAGRCDRAEARGAGDRDRGAGPRTPPLSRPDRAGGGGDGGAPRSPPPDRRAADVGPRSPSERGDPSRRAADPGPGGGRAGGPGADPERALERLATGAPREERLRAASLRAALERTGTPSLADFRATTGHRDLRRIDAAWARRALRAGVAPHLVLAEVAERGALAGSLPEARLAHATRTLARSLAAVRPERPVPEVVSVVAQAVALAVKLPLAVVKALLVVRSVAQELAQDRGR